MEIIGIFANEEHLVNALKKMREKGVEVKEVFTPYPSHEVLELMKRSSKMTVAAWFYGFTGALGVLGFLYYTSVIDWPLNYGGKPFNSFPSFIVITVVLTIFIVTILSLFTFSIRAKIYPGKTPVIVDERATDDKFVVVLESGDEEGLNEMGSWLRELGAVEINERGEAKV